MKIRRLIADTFDIELHEVTPTLRLHAIPEWSSLDHVTLMAALEVHFDRVVDGPLLGELTSVSAIEQFFATDGSAAIQVDTDPGTDTDTDTDTDTNSDSDTTNRPTIQRGLDGVYFDESTITSIDGDRGELLIRGYPIEELVANANFQEVCHLVLWGERPTTPADWQRMEVLTQPNPVDDRALGLMEELHAYHPLVALRTLLSMRGTAGLDARPDNTDVVRADGLQAVAAASRLLAAHRATAQGRCRPAPVDADSPATIFLTQFLGSAPSPLQAEALDLVMAIQVDHGANASTFSARVTAATGTDLAGAIVSGLSTFAGSLHGGAVEGVSVALDEIEHPDQAASYVAAKRAQRQPVMGFGHRVYRTSDPRSTPLRTMAERLSVEADDRRALDTMIALEAAMVPYQRHGLAMNVDCYSAVIYRLLGIPADYHASMYALSRMVGWTAHLPREALTIDVAEAWAAAAPGSVVENLYGPTELTIACSRYRWDQHCRAEAEGGVVPIGEVFSTMDACIVDGDGENVVDGEPGELCIAGPQQFAGYWRDPAQTATRILERAGRRYYRTGDRLLRAVEPCTSLADSTTRCRCWVTAWSWARWRRRYEPSTMSSMLSPSVFRSAGWHRPTSAPPSLWPTAPGPTPDHFVEPRPSDCPPTCDPNGWKSSNSFP